MHRHPPKGFTLIEIAIVLVILGLIISGVILGKHLIMSASAQAQVRQWRSFTMASSTFQTKYSYLPGDIPASKASAFGFSPRGTAPGTGDGNGFILGYGNGNSWGWIPSTGETGMFWVDLSKAKMIEGNFTTASATVVPSGSITGANIGKYFPEAALGEANYVYVWGHTPVSGFPNMSFHATKAGNYFGVSLIQSINGGASGKITSQKRISVTLAYEIDKKMDDGLPKSGSVLAVYLDTDPYWSDGTNILTSPPDDTTSASVNSCYNNNNKPGVKQEYSLKISNGTAKTCGLSYRFR